jgi:hypothetical protein
MTNEPEVSKPGIPKTEKFISRPAAERAIYIDFEGFTDQTPALLGILIDDHFEQVVLDPRLQQAAEAKHLRVVSLDAIIKEIVNRANSEKRQIVAYTQHEKNVVLRFANIDLTGPYRDARMIAMRWRRRPFETGNTDRTLKNYLKAIGFVRGAYLGDRLSTTRLGEVIKMLDERTAYDKLTAVKKAKWTKLLSHNRIDCEGMKALVLYALNAPDSRKQTSKGNI